MQQTYFVRVLGVQRLQVDSLFVPEERPQRYAGNQPGLDFARARVVRDTALHAENEEELKAL